ncbi:MAG TPA: glycosyltransferase family 4 protein [Magnetococcales bacterium]|nr:glycosyltransferase family 4 protein [Magnetococcales bacterium]
MSKKNAMNITLYLRKPNKLTYSIERLFADVATGLPPEIIVASCVSKYGSSGLFKRLYNCIEAIFYQGNVNHVTGDVHFLTYFLKRRRTILTIHDCFMMEKLSGFRRWLFRLLWLRIPERCCSVITAVSEETRRQVIKYTHCNPAKVRVIHCNVSKEFVRTPKKINTTHPRLLQIGITPNKNIERLIQALEGLNCTLVIIGVLTDAYKQALNRHQISYESMENLSREALVEQYVLCDLLVFVSLYEGFGLPIIEANAVGRPVLTSNMWSMPEVAGDAACLVNPYSVADIRRGLLRILEDKDYRERLIDNGFINAERFGLDKIAAQYVALYHEVGDSVRT